MYQALYRKWRPKLFSDVVGQDHVTKTLQNEIKLNRIGHAYLFIGSRGTGKTSCAKIFAKAVNCLENVDGNPCGQCEICDEIEKSKVMDIVELDAASNNGVNDIREICDSANFTPAKAKYRVYIIDEVHMLSQGAFNALLKTLEEPPSHVIFILATTEAHKIPATILSRCQRFEFNKIKPENIKNRLLYIAEKENIELSEKAASIIARLSDGAMRDALTILDKCMGVTSNITEDEVTNIVGIENSENLFYLAESIIDQKIDKVFEIVESLNKGSKNFSNICEEMINLFRNLMIIKSVDNGMDLVSLSSEDYEKLKALAEKVSIDKIIYILDELSSSLNKMSKVINPKIEFEMCFVKLCSPEMNVSIYDLKRRIDKLEATLNGKNFEPIKNEEKTKDEINKIKSKSPKISNKVKEENTQETVVTKKAIKPLDEELDLKTEPEEKKENIQNNSESKNQNSMQEILEKAELMKDWPKVLEVLKSYSPTVSLAFKNSKAYLSDPFVLIDSDNEVAFELLRKSSQRDKMRLAIKEVTGKNYKLGPYKKEKKNEVKIDPLAELADEAKKLGINVTTK